MMLSIQNLSVSTKDHVILSGIHLEIPKGTAVGLTGQSGSGKTTILKSLMGILGGQCHITGGKILLDGKRIDALPARRRRQLNGTTFGFIPQNPMTAFDPRFKIKKQLLETFRLKLGLSQQAAEEQIKAAFSQLRLSDAERIMESYPSELSGGMLQRIVMAYLLIMTPDYILADEPTSALDEENSKTLLELLDQQKSTSGIMLVSHDIEALSTLCEHLYVIENGKVLEDGAAERVLEAPSCEWTRRFVEAYRKSKDEVWKWKEL